MSETVSSLHNRLKMPSLIKTVFLLITLLHIKCEATYSHVYPETVQMLVNSTVNIFCTIDLADFPDRTSKNLYFERVQYGRIPSQSIKILNETTIQLHINQATESDSGMYQCFVSITPGTQKGVGMSKVSIGYKPLSISDFQCRSYNWQRMVCTFTKPDNPVPTSHEVTVYPRVTNLDYLYPCNLSYVNDKFECVFEEYTGIRSEDHILFRIKMENNLGQRTQDIEIDRFRNLIPAEVRNLTYTNLTSRSITIIWEIPFEVISLTRHKKVKFVHDVQLCSEYDSSWVVVDLSNLQTYEPDRSRLYYSIQINDLQYANAWYDARVRLRVQDAIDPEDMWSNATTLNFRTKSRNPDRPPELDTGAFYINGYNEVMIFWKELLRSERNGNNTHYVVDSVKRNGRETSVQPIMVTNTMAKFSKLDMDSDYEFSVRAVNDDGSSPRSSSIRVPRSSQRLSHPRKLKKSSQGNEYNLTWEPNLSILEMGPVTYSVFWCKPKNSLSNACDDGFDFAHVDQETYSFRLEKNESVNFAIAVSNARSTSGMSWTMCTSSAPNEIGQIKTVWVKHIEATQMEIEWKLECEDMQIVQGYNVSYCPLKSIIDPKRQECKEPEISVNVSGSATKYNVTNLKPYTTYKIVISMYSESREGPKSKPLENTTLEAAPSPPRELKAYDVRNTSMMLQWRVPEYINGVLMYYEIHFNNQNIKVHDIKNDTTKEPYEIVEYNLTNLTSFTTYQVLVLACTRYCSAKSNVERRKTAIGVPGTMMQPNTRVNDTFVDFSWQEPLFKGGRIDYYELKFVSKKKDQIVEERITKICGTSTKCRRLPICMDGNDIYEFYVRAVNVIFSPHAKDTNISCSSLSDYSAYSSQYIGTADGARAQPLVDGSGNPSQDLGGAINKNHHTRHRHKGCEAEMDKDLLNFQMRDPYAHHLFGNWSKPSATNCYRTSAFDYKTIGTMVFSVIVMLILLIMSYQFYKKVRDMKNIVIVLPPGLEDITREVKPSDLEKKPKSDIISNGHLTSMFNIGEDDHLLHRRAESNSSGRSHSDGGHSENQSEGPTDTAEDNSYDGQQLMDNDSQSISFEPVDQDYKNSSNSFEHDTANSTPLKTLVSSTPIRMAPTTSASPIPSPVPTATPSTVVSGFPVGNNMASGYVKPSMMRPNAPSYVQPSAAGNPRPATNFNASSGYVPVNQFGQPDMNAIKTPIVASTDASGISGYVTHKQLSDFGHRMQ